MNIDQILGINQMLKSIMESYWTDNSIPTSVAIEKMTYLQHLYDNIPSLTPSEIQLIKDEFATRCSSLQSSSIEEINIKDEFYTDQLSRIKELEHQLSLSKSRIKELEHQISISKLPEECIYTDNYVADHYYIE
jgi:hypothetical protein